MGLFERSHCRREGAVEGAVTVLVGDHLEVVAQQVDARPFGDPSRGVHRCVDAHGITAFERRGETNRLPRAHRALVPKEPELLPPRATC
eukprot:426331-Prymnesium_polylepis.2